MLKPKRLNASQSANLRMCQNRIFKTWTAQNQTRIGPDQQKNDTQTKLPGLGKESNTDWTRPDWIRFLRRGGTGSRPWGRSPNPDKIKTWTRPDQTNKKTIPRLDYLNQEKINPDWSRPDWIRFSRRDRQRVPPTRPKKNPGKQ